MNIRHKALLFILMLGTSLGSPAVLLAQSAGLVAQEDDAARAKQVLQRLRDGIQPNADEVDLLERLLLRTGVGGIPKPAAQDKITTGATATSVGKHPMGSLPEANLGLSTYKTKEGIVYVYSVDLGTSILRPFWLNRQHQPYGSVARLEEEQRHDGYKLDFAINGGIFDEQYRPKGLYLEQGKSLTELDTNRPGQDHGNFYLDPNGVFIVDGDGKARIFTTQRFNEQFPAKARGRLQLAVQSGPALLIDGVINPQFATDSVNKKRRSGVGVLTDQRVVFAMSAGPISFYEFASLFARVGCRNALYLDGGPVGSFYSKQDKLSIQVDSPLVTMLGVIQAAQIR